MTEVDDIVAGMKRSAMRAEYHRRLRVLVRPDEMSADQPVFTRHIETPSMRLAAMAASRQGFDAGRYAEQVDCPYGALVDPATTFLRRAWFMGFTAGRNVTPRPEPRTLEHIPVRLLT